jgi:hypothetical protein
MTYSLLLLQIACLTKPDAPEPQIGGSATVHDGEGCRLNGEETFRESSAPEEWPVYDPARQAYRFHRPDSRLVSVVGATDLLGKTFSDDAENSSWRLGRLETRRWEDPKSLRGSL